MGLGLFRKLRPPLHAVIDVGSHSLKALVFEIPEPRKPPRVVNKKVIKLPAEYSSVRTVSKLRETAFIIVKELGRVPEKIVIALGPSISDYYMKSWELKEYAGRKSLTRKDLGVYFKNLFEQNRDPSRALIAYPLDILAGGYPIDPGPAGLRGVKDLAFSTILLYFPSEIGASLAEMRRSLGGLPVEFIPLVAAHQESFCRVLKVCDALLVDVGGEETTVSFLKDSRVAGVIHSPVGARHFLRGMARIASISLEEAEDIKKQYAQGVMSEDKKMLLSDFLRQEVELWKKRFIEAIGGLYTMGPLPERVLLFGGGAYLPEIAEVLKGADWIKDFSHVESTQVKIVSAENIFEGDTLGGFLRGPAETGLASLIVYSLYHEPVL